SCQGIVGANPTACTIEPQPFCTGSLAHRARAACAAISFFLSAVSLAARAGPPRLPPSLPSATAAGFFGPRGNSNAFFLSLPAPDGLPPIAPSTTRKALWVSSPVLERLRIHLSMA